MNGPSVTNRALDIFGVTVVRGMSRNPTKVQDNVLYENLYWGEEF